MQTKIIEKYFFFGLLVATLLLTFFIFKPFLIMLILGISFAIVLYPVYLWFKEKHLPNWLSSLITVFLFVIVLCGPILGVGAIVFKQSQDVYQKFISNGSSQPLLNSINYNVNKILPDGVAFNINDKATEFISYISNNVAKIFTSTLSAFFSFLLMLLIIFYLLKDGAKCKEVIIKISPLEKEKDEEIINKLSHAVNGIIKGSLLLAVFQGIFVGFGFWFFGISNFALWGVVAGVCSLIPPIGATLVSAPAIIFLFISGYTARGIGLFIWAIVILALIDGFLRPFLVSKKINVPPILILFSILGGMSFLGPAGILIGPLTLSLLFALISIYKNEFSKI